MSFFCRKYVPPLSFAFYHLHARPRCIWFLHISLTFGALVAILLASPARYLPLLYFQHPSVAFLPCDRVCLRGSDNARSATRLFFVSSGLSPTADRPLTPIDTTSTFFLTWRHPILNAVSITPHPTLLLPYSFCPSSLWRSFSLSLLGGMTRCSPLLSSPSPPSS